MSITTLAEQAYGALTLSVIAVTEAGADPSLAYDVWCDVCGDFPVTRCTEGEARAELAGHVHEAAAVPA